MENLYNRIVRLGQEKGFKNITALCAAADVPRSNMTELNKGRSSTISLQNAIKLAKTLECSVEYLMNEQKESPSPVEDELSEKQRDLIAVVSELPDDVVSFLLAAAKEWLSSHKSAGSAE